MVDKINLSGSERLDKYSKMSQEQKNALQSDFNSIMSRGGLKMFFSKDENSIFQKAAE